MAEAHGGLQPLADETALNRENPYGMLSREGNPRFSSLSRVLDKLGSTVSVKPKPVRTAAA